MAKSVNMEKEYFHLLVHGKISRVFKSGKIQTIEYEDFISAEDLGYTQDNTNGFDQNAFMFNLIGKCQNLEELKTIIAKKYNEQLIKKFLSGDIKVHREITQVDEVVLCAHNIFSNGYKMPTYSKNFEEYTVVPEIFNESYVDPIYKKSVAFIRGIENVSNPFNIIRDSLTRLIDRKDIACQNQKYSTYYNTLLRGARKFFEGVLNTKLNGLIEYYQNYVNLLIEETKNKYPNSEFIHEDGTKFYSFYTDNFGHKRREKFEDSEYITKDAKIILKAIESERTKLREFFSIKSDEKFLIYIFENEEKLFKNSGLRGNSIKFYIFLAQLANQLKLQEVKRLIYLDIINSGIETYDPRTFATLYPIDDVGYEIAARGSVSDTYNTFKAYNDSMNRLNDATKTDDCSMVPFDKFSDEQDFVKSSTELSHSRVLFKRNPDCLF